MKAPRICMALTLLMAILSLSSCEKNQAPSCNIIEPVNGFVAVKGDIIAITVEADDAEGTVNEVRLYLNESALALLNFPFKHEINTMELATGSYTLKAMAIDNEGMESSDELQFVIDAAFSVVSTDTATSIGYNSAISGGKVSDDGGGEVSNAGVYWDTTSNCELAGTKVSMGAGSDVFSGSLSGLPHGTRIYYRAYAVNTAGESLGQELFFTTNTVPSVQTGIVNEYTNESATVHGAVTDNGGEEITETGIYWGTDSLPETTGNKLAIEHVEGVFSTLLIDLAPDTKYHVKAYAINAAGESLGKEMSFTTTGAAKVTTLPLISEKYKAVVIGGNVTEDDGNVVSERGMYWGTSQDLINTGTKLPAGSGLGSFQTALTDLSMGTVYYYMAYAVNVVGESYGEEMSFELTPIETGSFVDPRDQNEYESVKIGAQVWMAENLRAIVYNDGTEIPVMGDSAQWTSNSGPAYIWNSDDPEWAEDGALYNWYAVNTQKLCPAGWHVPSDQEWKELEIYLGMEKEVTDNRGFRGTNEAGMLKTIDLWESPNPGATDELNFSVKPAGRMGYSGDYAGLYLSAYLWASDVATDGNPYRRAFWYENATISRTPAYKNSGFSVRCVMDK